MRPILHLCILLSLSMLHAGDGFRVLRKEPIPNRLLRQGDALLIRDDTYVGVRIDLNTRHLERVCTKILSSEQTNWPNHAGSQAYQFALQATEPLRQQGGKHTLQIDWLITTNGTGIVELRTADQCQTLRDLPAAYLHQNLILILKDQFGLSISEATQILASSQP